MSRKLLSSLIAAALCVALGSAPVLAADTGSQMGDMPGMKMKSAGGQKMAKAVHAKHKMSCYDFAWDSQDMKDCLAKQGGAPAAK